MKFYLDKQFQNRYPTFNKNLTHFNASSPEKKVPILSLCAVRIGNDAE